MEFSIQGDIFFFYDTLSEEEKETVRKRMRAKYILEKLHTFAGGEVAGAMGQPSGISTALHVWRDKYQSRHVSSGSCRWTSWASSNLI